LFLFQDIWNIKHVLQRTTKPQNEILVDVLRKQNPNLKIVIYFPLDSTPFNDHWLGCVGSADAVVTYTEWARDHIKEMIQQTDFPEKEVHAIPHAIDYDVFKVLDTKKSEFYRRKRGWAHKFVVYSINRYQPRKNFAAMLRAFNLFLSGYKKCECGNYYNVAFSKCDLNGCGTDKVASIIRGKPDVHYYLHCEWTNYAMGSDRGMPEFDLPSALRSAGFTYDQINEKVEVLSQGSYEKGLISLKELNQIYNAGDLFVTSTFGEGWGLTVNEALVTGTPVIVPNNTSMPELVGSCGTIVNNSAFTFLPMDNNSKRPVPSVEGMVEALEMEYNKWLKNGKKKVQNIKGIKRGTRITWPNVVGQFDTLFKKVHDEPQAKTYVADSPE
jgi:glycosyltransferase involved in cell wall biosynthesis